MEKITLEQFTPETENIIQWVNAFNYEEELNKVNKYTVTPKQENIKIIKKINFSCDNDELFNITEFKETAQKPATQQPTIQNIKTVQKIKIEEDEE